MLYKHKHICIPVIALIFYCILDANHRAGREVQITTKQNAMLRLCKLTIYDYVLKGHCFSQNFTHSLMDRFFLPRIALAISI